jgi:hypothetical protein
MMRRGERNQAAPPCFAGIAKGIDEMGRETGEID